MVENELAVTRGSLSQTQATTQTSEQIFFWCERSITESLEIPEWNDSAAFWAPEATASSVSQSGTEESNSLPFCSNSLPFHSNSLTHSAIVSCINIYTLSHTLLYSLKHTTILSHIHYYTLLHTLLFTLSHTIFSCINNYTLPHTLLYSHTYTTILSHIHFYTLLYILVKGV